MLGQERECGASCVKSGATAFPPPLWGRDREGGTTRTAVISIPMPGECRFKTPDTRNLHSQNLRVEAASRALRCRHPLPCPSPNIRAFTPVFAGYWGEGTVWHPSSQLSAEYFARACCSIQSKHRLPSLLRLDRLVADEIPDFVDLVDESLGLEDIAVSPVEAGLDDRLDAPGPGGHHGDAIGEMHRF